MRFNILGKSYEIDHATIVGVASSSVPEFFDGRHKYFVRIDGRRYPIKQLLAGATGLSNTEFTAQYAHRILTKLGFDVEELAPTAPRPRFRPREGRLRFDHGLEPPNSHQNGEFQPGAGPNVAADALKFAVTLDQDEDGFVFASCPALPGCHSQGRTRKEALNNIAEAIRGYVASMQKHQEDVPDVDWEVVEVTP